MIRSIGMPGTSRTPDVIIWGAKQSGAVEATDVITTEGITSPGDAHPDLAKGNDAIIGPEASLVAPSIHQFPGRIHAQGKVVGTTGAEVLTRAEFIFRTGPKTEAEAVVGNGHKD